MARISVAFAAFLLALACGGGEVEQAATESETPAVEATPIGGMYEVSGVTVATESGYKRAIEGTVILAVDGDRYTATYNLTTTYPDPEGDEPLAAEVIGKGEGEVEGRTLRGTAETQLVVATVPNVDPAFAFIPRTVSTRIVSAGVTTIAADGTAHIEIENKPAPGETYAPTRSTLTGRRVSAAGVGDVAAQAE